ncbi:hypothetical protein J2Z66_003128 [Paenibacillus eucommiae]|uniref:Uncharacterized protein n=1 Tax=Paenibacillus eucommiae TaxID=1355755 RepID=A0ABS4IVA3_9BACL|nr:hypothetical protein [Paenibacillus eucommiae]
MRGSRPGRGAQGCKQVYRKQAYVAQIRVKMAQMCAGSRGRGHGWIQKLWHQGTSVKIKERNPYIFVKMLAGPLDWGDTSVAITKGKLNVIKWGIY